MVNFPEVNMRIQSYKESIRHMAKSTVNEEVKSAYYVAIAALNSIEQILVDKEALYLQEEARK